MSFYKASRKFSMVGLVLWGVLFLAAVALVGCQPAQSQTGEASSGEETAVSPPEIPTVLIDITDEAINVPADFPGGIVAVTVKNSSSQDLDVGFTRVLAGQSSDEIIQMAENYEENMVPLSQMTSSLGSFNPISAGAEQKIIIDFRTGEFIADATEHSEAEPIPGAPHLYSTFKAETIVGTVEPKADVTVELHDFAYVMPDEIKAGKQLWEFNNKGNQWHMMVVVKPSPDVTIDDLMAVLQAEGEPAGPPPFEFVNNAGMPPIGAGERVWVEYEMEAGTYLTACPLPDMAAILAGGAPMSHLSHGMHHVLKVN